MSFEIFKGVFPAKVVVDWTEKTPVKKNNTVRILTKIDENVHQNKEKNANNLLIDRVISSEVIGSDYSLAKKANAKKVLSYFVGKHNKNVKSFSRGFIDASLGHIARMTQLSKQNVRTSLKKIEKYILKKERNGNDKRELIYYLNTELFFTSNKHETNTIITRSYPHKTLPQKALQPRSYLKDSLDSKILDNNTRSRYLVSVPKKVVVKNLNGSGKGKEPTKKLETTPERRKELNEKVKDLNLVCDTVCHLMKEYDKQTVIKCIDYLHWEVTKNRFKPAKTMMAYFVNMIKKAYQGIWDFTNFENAIQETKKLKSFNKKIELEKQKQAEIGKRETELYDEAVNRISSMDETEKANRLDSIKRENPGFSDFACKSILIGRVKEEIEQSKALKAVSQEVLA